MANAPVTVANLIDDRAMGPLQYRAFVLAGLAILMDGYDTQAAAYVAPIISKEWALPTGAFGPVFAAGLIGSALGSLALAPLADRTGRKRVMVVSTIAIGLFTILCASAQSLHTLEPLRFLTGLGLGTALPNALALITARHVLIFAALPAVCAVILLLSTANPIKRVARSSKSPLG